MDIASQYDHYIEEAEEAARLDELVQDILDTFPAEYLAQAFEYFSELAKNKERHDEHIF